MELRHLRYFVTVAKLQNFRRAAEALRISQPPLSTQIRQLEEELGVVLFERTSRGALLTGPGREFLEHATAILDSVETAKDATLEVAGTQRGTLRVGCTFSSAYFYLLPRIIDNFRSIYPHANVDVSEITTIEQVEAISQGELDIGLVREPTYKLDDALELNKIWTEKLSLVLRKDAPLASRKQVSIDDLKDIPLVSYMLDRGVGLGFVLRQLCRNHGFEPNVIQMGNSITFIFGLVSSGLGAAVVPTMTNILRMKDLKFIPISDENAYCNLYTLHRAANQDKLLRSFLEVAKMNSGEG